MVVSFASSTLTLLSNPMFLCKFCFFRTYIPAHRHGKSLVKLITKTTKRNSLLFLGCIDLALSQHCQKKKKKKKKNNGFLHACMYGAYSRRSDWRHPRPRGAADQGRKRRPVKRLPTPSADSTADVHVAANLETGPQTIFDYTPFLHNTLTLHQPWTIGSTCPGLHTRPMRRPTVGSAMQMAQHLLQSQPTEDAQPAQPAARTACKTSASRVLRAVREDVDRAPALDCGQSRDRPPPLILYLSCL